MQAPQLSAEQTEEDDGFAEFLADLRDTPTPPAATQGTRTLPELPTATPQPRAGSTAASDQSGSGDTPSCISECRACVQALGA